MDCEFHLQDPTSPDTVYLFEAIIEAVQGAKSFTGMFAFASVTGVDHLIGDWAIQQFLRSSAMSLLVGIDAVTNRPTLERLRELEQCHENLSVRVFRNSTAALFHPKVARFEYPDGRRSMVVGSGNLTLGGLRRHFEAFSVMRATPDEMLEVAAWNRFFTDHAANIVRIDDAALKRAENNTTRRHLRPGERHTDATHAVEAPVTEVETPVGHTDRFLVAHIPGAGDRWRQVHFNKEVISEFFRIRPHTSERVFFVECRPDGTFVAPEPPRRCVYSETNKNHKIEIAARPGVRYPDSATGRPIIVFRELQTRSFAYMLLMPDEAGYELMSGLLNNLENVGAVSHGVRRIIATRTDIVSVWAPCPLVNAIDSPAEAGT